MFGYTAQAISLNDIVKSCSADLFHNMKKSNHCLHELSCPLFGILTTYVHVNVEHDFVLPACYSNLHKPSTSF